MEREVIVVGAGPAGSVAAMELAQRGHDVLLLDKSEFPRTKACGDGVLGHAIRLLDELGAGDPIRRAGFYPVHGLRYVSHRNTLVEVESIGAGYNAPRAEFDTILMRHAVSSGAEFRQAKVKGPLMEGDRVVGVAARIGDEIHKLRARVVIGAGGFASPISRSLRRHHFNPAHRGLAVRAYIDGLKTFPNRSEFYTLGPPSGGYAWIFPLGETRANIGIGMRLSDYRRYRLNLNKMLAGFLDRPEIRERLTKASRIREAAVWPLDSAAQRGVRRAFDGAVLIGDAAALIDPFDGGGIPNAFLSARLASAVIHKSLRAGDVGVRSLRRYEELCHQVIVKRMMNRYRQARVLTSLPLLLDWVFKAARHNPWFVRKYEALYVDLNPLLQTALRSMDS